MTKTKHFEQYRNSGYVWIEDKVENAIVGAELGLESLVMEHGFNMNDSEPIHPSKRLERHLRNVDW